MPSSSCKSLVQINAGFVPQIWMPPPKSIWNIDIRRQGFTGVCLLIPQASRTADIGFPTPIWMSRKRFPQPEREVSDMGVDAKPVSIKMRISAVVAFCRPAPASLYLRHRRSRPSRRRPPHLLRRLPATVRRHGAGDGRARGIHIPCDRWSGDLHMDTLRAPLAEIETAWQQNHPGRHTVIIP